MKMSEPTPAKCHCGSSSWGKEPETGRYTCVSCYRPLWMPMETAPKDGTTILVYGEWPLTDPIPDIAFVHWDADDKTWTFDGEDMLIMYYWMPLPEPPKLD